MPAVEELRQPSGTAFTIRDPADLPVVYPVLSPGEGVEAALAVLRTFAP